MLGSSFRGGRGMHSAVLAAWALVALAGAALGQSNTQPSDSKPLLQGPAVKDNSLPGERSSFTKGGGGDKGKFAARPTPHPVFMRAVESLNADDAAAETRMTSDQESQIKSIDETFRSSQRDFIQKHRDEVRELAQKLPPEERGRIREQLAGAGFGAGGKKAAPGNGKDKLAKKLAGQVEDPKAAPPAKDTGDEMMTPPKATTEQDVQAARDKLRKLYEAGPKPEEAHAKIWAVLTENQRKAVETQLKKFRDEMQQREMNGPAEKRLEKKVEGKLADQAKKNADAGPITSIDDPRIPERARERLKNLPADQQQAALQKLQERFREERAKRRTEPSKPAPSLDEVNIPKPDDNSNPK